MMFFNKSSKYVFALTCVFIFINTTQGHSAEITGEARVIDGDTVDIGPVRIRLHGIDAPESDQPCAQTDGGSWKCGTAATSRLADMIDGHLITCEARDRDAYGRIIGVCFKDDIDLNALLVREGLAWAYVRFSEDYITQELSAQAEKIGIWQAETTPPWEYRAQRWERAASDSPRPGCPIKGNINRNGERIYHTPWSPWYDRVQIDETSGERWFCDEAEAEAAGWRATR
jgi:endonuclease YncB( thermonuclease family)